MGNKVHLTTYDTVVAVTQIAINNALADYLYAADKNVDLYYIVDGEGNYEPAQSPADAMYSFTGIRDIAFGDPKRAVEMLQLYVTDHPQTVLYKITFSKARFVSKMPAYTLEQSDKPDAKPWVISFRAKLALQEAELAKLPEDVRRKVEAYVRNLGPDMFSIQQLCLDLDTAVFDSYEGIDGISKSSRAYWDLAAILQDYLARQKAKGEVLFGYSVKKTAPANVATPTFMPTDLNFCVTRYRDEKGKFSNPELDTLNYLVMTDHRPLPADPPSRFEFNWVDSESDHGRIAVRRDLVMPIILGELEGFLPALAPSVHADAKNDRVSLNANGQARLFTSKPATGPTLASFDYSAGDDDTYHTSKTGILDSTHTVMSARYSSHCELTLPQANILRLTGWVKASAGSCITTTVMGKMSTTSLDMPETTFHWSVDLRLRAALDSSKNGLIELVTENGDFSSSPSVKGRERSWWDRFFGDPPGFCRIYLNDFGDLRSQMQSHIMDQLLPKLNETLAAANAFVFPGGKTFTFHGPAFSDTRDLTSLIEY